MTSDFAAFEPVRAVAHDPTFWSDFFFLSHSDRDYASISNYDQVIPADTFHKTPGFTLKCCRLIFPVTGQRGLILGFNCSLSNFSLNLLQDDGTQAELGWDDEAHWHPHVLRWGELELICKRLSLRDPLLVDPGLPLLLLCRWAPVTDADDAERISALLQRACDRVGVTSAEVSRSIFALIDERNNGFEWRRSPELGWTLHQDNPLDPRGGFRYKRQLYTLRSPDNDAFPFKQFNAMIQDAHGESRQV